MFVSLLISLFLKNTGFLFQFSEIFLQGRDNRCSGSAQELAEFSCIEIPLHRQPARRVIWQP